MCERLRQAEQQARQTIDTADVALQRQRQELQNELERARSGQSEQSEHARGIEQRHEAEKSRLGSQISQCQMEKGLLEERINEINFKHSCQQREAQRQNEMQLQQSQLSQVRLDGALQAVSGLEGEAKRMKASAALNGEFVAELRGQIGKMEHDTARQKAQIQAKSHETASLGSKLEASEAQVEALQGGLRALQVQFSGLQGSLALSMSPRSNRSDSASMSRSPSMDHGALKAEVKALRSAVVDAGVRAAMAEREVTAHSEADATKKANASVTIAKLEVDKRLLQQEIDRFQVAAKDLTASHQDELAALRVSLDGEVEQRVHQETSNLLQQLLEVREQQKTYEKQIQALSSTLQDVKGELSSTAQEWSAVEDAEECGKLERNQMITFLSKLTEEHGAMMKAREGDDSKRKHDEDEQIRAMLSEVETHRSAAKKAQKEAVRQEVRSHAAEAAKSELEASLVEQMTQYESRMNALLDAACKHDTPTQSTVKTVLI